MILYLDTSSLVKLYVDEPGSEDVLRLVDQAELVTTSVVAYAEARAALARRRREKDEKGFFLSVTRRSEGSYKVKDFK